MQKQSTERIRAVFDCMIFLQGAARRDGAAGICLDLAEQSVIELCVSRAILTEVEDVLRRPTIRSKFPALTDDVVSEFVAVVERFSTVVEEVPREIALERDPKDEPYLNLAIHVTADYLVSRDKDLLDLASDSSAVGLALRDRCPGLKIVEPPAFLLAMRDRTPVAH